MMIMWLWWTGWGASKYCDIGLKKIKSILILPELSPCMPATLATTGTRAKIP